MHGRSSTTTPRTCAWTKNLRRHFHELLLLQRGQTDHAVPLIWIAKRGENSTLQPKIGVSHVRGLQRSGNAQGQTAEFLDSHSVPNGKTQRWRATEQRQT